MNNIIGILLTSLVVIFAFMIFSIWLMNYILRLYIGRKHSLLEEMVEMQRIPVRWSRKFDEKIVRAEGDDRKISHIREQAGFYYLRKLKQLKKYVQRSTLVRGDETRQVLFDSIDNLSHEWRNARHGFRLRAAQAQEKG